MPQGKSRLSAAELNLSLATSAGECERGYFVINHGASKTTLLRQRISICAKALLQKSERRALNCCD